MKLEEISYKNAKESKEQFLLVAGNFCYVCIAGHDPALEFYRIVFKEETIKYYRFIKEK